MLQTRMQIAELSNDELISSLKTTIAEEKRLVARVITYLIEVEDRRLHLELACPSMYEFCLRRLGFSEGEACRRLAVARLARTFPQLLPPLASGQLHLSSILLLRDLFTAANVEELISMASGKSKREVEELIARLAPRPDVPSLIQMVPEQAGLTMPCTGPSIPPRRKQAHGDSMAPSQQVSPLSEERYKVQLTATKVLRDKLEQAKALMSHGNPSGDLAVIVEAALDLLITKLEKRRFGKTERPRTARPPADPSAISQATRRAVFERDGKQCTYVSPDGVRCPERARLQLDHVDPRARGGNGDAENLRVACQAHNLDAAKRVFGRTYVEAKVHRSQRRCAEKRSNQALVEKALVSMGFRSGEVQRALSGLVDATWNEPLEAILRAALARLT